MTYSLDNDVTDQHLSMFLSNELIIIFVMYNSSHADVHSSKPIFNLAINRTCNVFKMTVHVNMITH